MGIQQSHRSELTRVGHQLYYSGEILERVITRLTGNRIGSTVQMHQATYQGCSAERLISELRIFVECNVDIHAVIQGVSEARNQSRAGIYEQQEPIQSRGSRLQRLSEFTTENLRLLVAKCDPVLIVDSLRGLLLSRFTLLRSDS